MEPNYRRCCGIDVHKKNVAVCILPPQGRTDVEIRKRTFRTFTRDLGQRQRCMDRLIGGQGHLCGYACRQKNAQVAKEFQGD
jgi:hypothetical protein